MNKFLLFLISLLVGIGLFIWIGKIVDWGEIGRAFSAFTSIQWLVIFGLTLLIAIFGAWRWQEILKERGVRIPFPDIFRPYLAGFAVMFFMPVVIFGGEFFRTYILRKRNLVPWSKGMASVLIDRILEWTANLTIIFAGTLFFLYKIGLPPKHLGIIFGAAFFIFCLGISYFYLKIFRKESITKVIAKRFGLKRIEENNTFLEIEEEIFNSFKSKKMLWAGLGVSFFKATAMYFRALVLIFFLGKSIGGASALSILGFSYLAAMIPIPAALGSHEAIQAFTFHSLGLGFSTATAFTMVIRGMESVIALAGVVILLKLGIELIKNALLKKTEKLILMKNNNKDA